MAPTITSVADYPKEHLSLNHKVRKPIVEKMRRDRINNSIEQLKDLLGPQLLNQQIDSKLEKADILEMTVCLLRRQLQTKTPKVLPLSKDEVQTQSHGTVLDDFQTLKPSSDWAMEESSSLLQLRVLDQHTLSINKSPAQSALWRPW